MHARNAPSVAQELRPDPGSFRDRSNRVYDDGNRVLRGIDDQALANWRQLIKTDFFCELLQEGKIVQTAEVREVVHGPDETGWAAHLSHQRVPFVSYPYEWSFGMLKDAALLHLEMLERALPAGWTLKDASAYNIQWFGSRPVFIDIPSFEPHVEGEPWVGYRQFCMMFLYPLMLRAYKGVDYVPFLRSSLEGIDPSTADQILSGVARFRKGVLGHVYLHARMQNRSGIRDLAEAKALTEDSGLAGPAKRNRARHSLAMLMGTVQGLRRTVERLNLPDRRTTWGDYDKDHSYAAQSFDAKQEFVRKHVKAKHRPLVWDLGCNTGIFSKICAENSDYVIAVDGDEKAVDRLFTQQKLQSSTKILPLVMDLGNVSPGQGWRGRERKSFDARGKPGLILCLALIHHIVISGNIPLSQFLEWLREFDSDVIIESVGLNDGMTKMLLKNRANQYEELSDENFKAELNRLFVVRDSVPLKGGVRELFFLEPR